MGTKQASTAWKGLVPFMMVLCVQALVAHETLLLHYPFDEGVGVDVLDVSGNENHAMTNNMDDGDWVAGKEAKFGTALDFDGSNDFVKSTTFFSQPLDGDFSASVWFKVGPGQNARVIGFNEGQTVQINLRIQNRIGIKGGGVVGDGTTWGPVAIDDNQWHHFVVVRDGMRERMILYLDGEFQADVALSAVVTLDNVTLGALSNSNTDQSRHLKGALDEFSIYTVALTLEEIRYLKANLVVAAVDKAGNPSPAD